MALVEGEACVDEEDVEVPAEVVGDRDAKPRTAFVPVPAVEDGCPDGILGQVPGDHDEAGDCGEREDAEPGWCGGERSGQLEDGLCDLPGDPGHADVGEAEQDWDVEELGAHELEEFVAAVWEAGGHAEVFNAVADDDADGGEDEEGAEAVAARSVDESETERGENVESDDRELRDWAGDLAGNGAGEDFKHARGDVAGEDQAERGREERGAHGSDSTRHRGWQSLLHGALIVALEDDLFAMPAVAGKLVADTGDHVVEAADVGVDVKAEVGGRGSRVDRRKRKRLAKACGAFLDDGADVVLNIAAQAGPAFVGTAERGKVMEVGITGGEGFEFFAIVELGFMARTVYAPDFLAFATIRSTLREEPLHEAAHGGDTGAGGDEDGVGDGRAQDEVAMRAVNFDGAAGGQFGQVG